MFGKVVLRNKSERGKNEWRSSFQNRKSLWEQKSVSGEMCLDENSSPKVRPHSLSTDQVSFINTKSISVINGKEKFYPFKFSSNSLISI